MSAKLKETDKEWRKTLFLEAVLARQVPVKTASKVLGLSLRTGYRTLRAFMENGEDAVIDHRIGPRKSSMDRINDYLDIDKV